LLKGSGFIALAKWYPTDSNVMFWVDDSVPLPGTNVVLCLDLTRDNANVILTARVLDKSQANAVVFERSFVDTPAVDPSLSANEFRQKTGITTLPVVPDRGAPLLSNHGQGGMGVAVFQFTDGHQPAVEAVFDNFEFRLHDVPPVSIARAVQLSWTAPAGSTYSVLGAPTTQGPWMPVSELEMPGLSRMTVPAGSAAQFFRLQQAP
jgi:hypothetical protein